MMRRSEEESFHRRPQRSRRPILIGVPFNTETFDRADGKEAIFAGISQPS
jgi:hypothetical protein